MATDKEITSIMSPRTRFKFWWGGGGGVSFFFCSQNVPPQVPNVFPKGVPNSTSFNRIHFAQSSPLLTYIGGPKGEALDLSIESFILGSLHSFNFFFCDGPIKLAHCQKKKEKKKKLDL